VAGASLLDWSDLAKATTWGSLILGNGFSINVWSAFKYDSLFEKAEPNLSEGAKSIFEALATTNFEQALKVTHYAALTDRALGRDEAATKALHAEIRQSLFDAVRGVHVPYGLLSTDMLTDIAVALNRYRNVYTTNYDLLPYWATMATDESRRRLKDRFWTADHTFDPSNIAVIGDATVVHYLHGGIHLWVNPVSGVTGKWVLSGDSLLDASHLSAHPDRVPLLISEASARKKAEAIRESDYLRMAFEALIADSSNVVIFGHSLSREWDDHIVKAMQMGARRNIAIGMRAASATESDQVGLRERLAPQNVLFFDSATHPLGSDHLHVDVP
jgi:hypothetical protein